MLYFLVDFEFLLLVEHIMDRVLNHIAIYSILIMIDGTTVAVIFFLHFPQNFAFGFTITFTVTH